MINKEIEITVGEYKATLTTYILSNSLEIDKERKRPMVIICPGGGYRFVSDREAEPVAIQMNAMGFHACILRYSIYPAKFPTALVQLAKAVVCVRENAEEWNVKKDKIIIAGFSAGGHLTASLANFWQEEFLLEQLQLDCEMFRPNGIILSYPVISSGKYAHQDSFVALLQEKHDEQLVRMSMERQVNPNTPPAFLWHTYEDSVVPVENSLLFTMAMREYNIPFELHIYPKGGHGLSLANDETISTQYQFGIQEECQNWITMAGTWINKL